MQIGNGEGGGVPPFPEYFVVERNYLHGPDRPVLITGLPSATGAINGTMAGQIAIRGNYIDNAYTREAVLQWFNFYLLDCGSGGTCNSGGPFLFDNNYTEGMDMNLIVEANNGVNPSVPHDITYSHNASYWPPSTLAFAQALLSYGCRDHVEFKNYMRAAVVGNYIRNQWACADQGAPIQSLSTGPTANLTVRSNLLTGISSVFTSSDMGQSGRGTSMLLGGDKINYQNNLVYDWGRESRAAGGGGAGSLMYFTGSGYMNVSLLNNSIIGPNVSGTDLIPLMIQSTAIYTGSMANMSVRKNVFPVGAVASAVQGGIYTQDSYTGHGVESHYSSPSGTNSQTFGTTDYTYEFGASAQLVETATAGGGMYGVSVISGGTGYPASGALVFGNCSSLPAAPTGSFVIRWHHLQGGHYPSWLRL